MKTDDTIWDIEPHTEAKHEILRYYLNAWFPILATTHNRLLYVDGFAGPGEYYKKDGSLTDGSPIIALKVAKDHLLRNKLQHPKKDLKFLLIEKDEGRYQNLTRKCKEIQWPSNFDIIPRNASFEEIFDDVLVKIEEQNKQLAPSFVFIDPFGPTGFPMYLIERLAQQPRSEILITFNSQALNRWYLSDSKKYKYVDDIYGSDIWLPALSISNTRQRENYLIEAYQKVIEQLGWRGRSFRMINKNSQTQYYLFFATSHCEGMLAMKAAMWSVAKAGDFTYSDLTDPQQLLLFDEELFDEDYSQNLALQLYENHRGQSILKQTLIRNDLAWHPICIGRHLTRALKILEYESTPQRILAVQNPYNRKRKKGSYPDDCTIVFAP